MIRVVRVIAVTVQMAGCRVVPGVSPLEMCGSARNTISYQSKRHPHCGPVIDPILSPCPDQTGAGPRRLFFAIN